MEQKTGKLSDIDQIKLDAIKERQVVKERWHGGKPDDDTKDILTLLKLIEIKFENR